MHGTRLAVLAAAFLLTIFSHGLAAQSYAPPPSAFTAYWEEPAFPEFPYRGPQAAKGVILWSHGVAGRDAEWRYPPPDVIRDFARAGWDVVKLQRNGLHEAGWTVSGTRHVAKLVSRIAEAHAQGYRAIIAAGQSYGGAISLEASARSDLLSGVLAFAPNHGSDSCGRSAGFTVWRMADNLGDMLVRAIDRVRAPRVAVVLAAGDECEGYNDPSAQVEAALQRHIKSFIHLGSSMPVRGHYVALTEQFRRWYGPCLMSFFDPAHPAAAGETRCDGPAPAPRFLLPAALPSSAKGTLAGAWSGAYLSTATHDDYNREVCVVIEDGGSDALAAVTAFGAGPENNLSMATYKRTFAREGMGFVYRGHDAYRMALVPDAKAEALRLAITSAGGDITWTGMLKRGC